MNNTLDCKRAKRALCHSTPRRRGATVSVFFLFCKIVVFCALSARPYSSRSRRRHAISAGHGRRRAGVFRFALPPPSSHPIRSRKTRIFCCEKQSIPDEFPPPPPVLPPSLNVQQFLICFYFKVARSAPRSFLMVNPPKTCILSVRPSRSWPPTTVWIFSG